MSSIHSYAGKSFVSLLRGFKTYGLLKPWDYRSLVRKLSTGNIYSINHILYQRFVYIIDLYEFMWRIYPYCTWLRMLVTLLWKNSQTRYISQHFKYTDCCMLQNVCELTVYINNNAKTILLKHPFCITTMGNNSYSNVIIGTSLKTILPPICPKTNVSMLTNKGRKK